MSIRDVIVLALSSLRAHLLRSGLTLFGIIIGVMSVITIIAALEALMTGVREQTDQLGPATFIVTRFGMITSRDDFLNALKRKNLTMKDMKAVEQGCSECELVGAMADTRTGVKHRNQGLRNVTINGSTANIIDILDIRVDRGRFFTDTEYNRKNQVAFVGPTIEEELFGEDPLGKEIKIQNRRFTVIGVAKKRGSFLGENQDNFVIIPLSTHLKIFGRPRFNFQLVMKSWTISGIYDAQDQVRAILRARRGVPYDQEDDFSILTAENILSFVTNLTRGVRIALVAISSIALVVGGIVIMNIMMVSVTERTREIGICKSLGARRRNILTQFLFEAIILSIGGGILGTAIGITIATVLGSFISLPVSPSLLAILSGLSISTGVGLFFGIYPALKASRLNPVEALKFE